MASMTTSTNIPDYSKPDTEGDAREGSMFGVVTSSSGESVSSMDDSFGEELVEKEECERELILVQWRRNGGGLSPLIFPDIEL